MNERVFVGMSGGVDSSVSAALLKEAGYDVTGVFIRVWKPDFMECTKTDDEEMARRAAAHLGIPFLVFDFADEYKREVVDYMIAEYKAGRTPNPDVMCNSRIKFGSFLKRAREMGADYVATGHHARLRREFPISNFQFPNKSQIQKSKSQTTALLSGVDKEKNQSYFLWTLTQEQLQHILFPIGEYEKSEVRKMAKERKLPNALRKDSQGLCFVGEFPMREFLEHFIPPKRGDVLNEECEIIGYHDGAFYLTIGQRHGFTITKKTPDDAPRYVVAKDVNANTVIVSTKKPDTGGDVKEVTLENVNWISGEMPEEGKECKARFRYRQPLVNANVKCQMSPVPCCSASATGQANVKCFFDESQGGIAPGQSLVVYDEDECLGGGIICG